MLIKYELLKVTYSAVGFRNYRDSKYRLDVLVKGCRKSLYYSSYKTMLAFLEAMFDVIDIYE